MAMDYGLWVIRFLHILSGVTWVGGAFLYSMVIAPRVLQRGPPPIRRPFLEAVLEPVTRYFYVAGVMTILTGFLVMGGIWGFDNISTQFQRSGYGTALGIGVIAALGMAAIGFGVIAPTGKKLLARMQAMPAPAPGTPAAPPPPEVQAEMAAMGKRIGMMSMLVVLLGTVALGAMAWAVVAR